MEASDVFASSAQLFTTCACWRGLVAVSACQFTEGSKEARGGFYVAETLTVIPGRWLNRYGL